MYNDRNESFSTIFIVMIIVLCVGGCMYCANKKTKEREQKNEADEISMIKKKQSEDSIKEMKINELDEFIKRYDAVDEMPDSLVFSFQIKRYLKDRNLFAFLIDYDIIEQNNQFFLVSQAYGNLYKIKLTNEQALEIVKVNKDQDVENKRKEALQVILNIDDVRRFSGGEFEVDENLDIFLYVNVSYEYNLIVGQLIEYKYGDQNLHLLKKMKKDRKSLPIN